MSATQSGSPFRLEAGEELYVYKLVKFDGVTAVLNTADATDRPFATVQPVIDSNYDDGEVMTLRDIKHAGTHKVVAAGAIGAGVDIYAADAGKVQALPAAAGTYLLVGHSLQAASGDGSIIEAWLHPGCETETVQGS